MLPDPKILFLDIDGVLNTNTDFTKAAIKYDQVHSRLQKGECWKIIQAGKLGLLNDIITQTGAKIVLSSTWREKCNGKKMTKIFQRYGKVWTHPKETFIGQTPKHYKRFSQSHMDIRQSEIETYIAEHAVSVYVIIDDAYQIDLPHGSTEDVFIKTDEDTGLTEDQALKAMNILGRLPKYQAKHIKNQSWVSLC